MTEVGITTIAGEGVDVVVIVITVIAPLSSVDDCAVVITVGVGVVVITIVVGAYVGDWEGCGVVDGDKEEGIVVIGVLEQLA